LVIFRVNSFLSICAAKEPPAFVQLALMDVKFHHPGPQFRLFAPRPVYPSFLLVLLELSVFKYFQHLCSISLPLLEASYSLLNFCSAFIAKTNVSFAFIA